MVGITGTNGKTTTAFLVRELLEAAGRRCGLLGTVKSVVGGREHAVVRTTPEAIDLQRTFREMLDAGDEACAMEISSHALELRRADGIHVGGGRLHEPHAGPPRLPPGHGGLLPGQAAAVRVRADRRADRQRRRSLRPPARGRVPGCDDVRGRRPGGLPRRRPAHGLRRLGVHRPHARRDVRGAAAAARALQRPQRAGGVGGGARAGRAAGGDRGRAGGGGPRAGALRAGRRGPAVRRARRLRAHARLARERPARGARAGR